MKTENACHIWKCQFYKAFCTTTTVQNTRNTTIQISGPSLTRSCYYLKKWEDRSCRQIITTIFCRDFNRDTSVDFLQIRKKKKSLYLTNVLSLYLLPQAIKFCYWFWRSHCFFCSIQIDIIFNTLSWPEPNHTSGLQFLLINQRFQ